MKEIEQRIIEKQKELIITLTKALDYLADNNLIKERKDNNADDQPLIDCVNESAKLRKEIKEITRLRAEQGEKQTTESGKTYYKVPFELSVETWDKLTPSERLKFKGLIIEKEEIDINTPFFGNTGEKVPVEQPIPNDYVKSDYTKPVEQINKSSQPTLKEMQECHLRSRPVEQSGILSAEDVYEVIESRISYFKEIYHKYEAIQLNNALHVIKNLIPPKQFEGKELPEEELRKIVKWMCDENISRFCDPLLIVKEYLKNR